MTSAVRPPKCAAMPSRTILTTESTTAAPPAVITPMARSVAPDALGSPGGAMDSRGWSTMSPGEQGEQRQGVAQVSGDEKVPSDVLAARRAHPADQLRVVFFHPTAAAGSYNVFLHDARPALLGRGPPGGDEPLGGAR